jgi:NAD(P)H-dependent FMN reductase
MSTSKLKVHVIVGSTRPARFGDKPAHYVLGRLNEHPEIQAELVDLRDWPLPSFDGPMAPARITNGEYGSEIVDRWSAKIAEADAYVITAAEYNHGYTAVLKNALDVIYHEWVRKPVSFIGYGGVGGARAIEQLRQVAIELQMAPIRAAVYLPVEVYLTLMKETAPAKPELFAPVAVATGTLVDDLVWWAKALREARKLAKPV